MQYKFKGTILDFDFHPAWSNERENYFSVNTPIIVYGYKYPYTMIGAALDNSVFSFETKNMQFVHKFDISMTFS